MSNDKWVCELAADEYPPTIGINRFRKFVHKRYAIYMKYKIWNFAKDDLTDDPILKKYKFTNVFRELDTGTIWCRQHIREPYANHKELFFNIALYRMYNRITTAEVIGFIDNYPTSNTEQKIRELRTSGMPIFTGAHMTTGSVSKGDKIYQMFNTCANYLWEHRRELEPKPGDTLKQAFDRISGKSPGVGPFIAYEIITDLRWTRYLKDSEDIMYWANPGPGAQRGIKRVYSLPVKYAKTDRARIDSSYPSDYDGMIRVMRYLLSIMNISRDYVPLTDTTVMRSMPNMEMRDIEHSLCEFDKYERVRLGEGRPRSVFNPS